MFPTLLVLFCSVNARTRPLMGTLGRSPVWINDWRTCNQNWISNFSFSVVKKQNIQTWFYLTQKLLIMFQLDETGHFTICHWRIGRSPSDQSGSEGCFSSWTRQNHELEMAPSQNVNKKWQAERFQNICFHLKQLLEKRTKDQEHKGHFLPRGEWLTPVIEASFGRHGDRLQTTDGNLVIVSYGQLFLTTIRLHHQVRISLFWLVGRDCSHAPKVLSWQVSKVLKMKKLKKYRSELFYSRDLNTLNRCLEL